MKILNPKVTLIKNLIVVENVDLVKSDNMNLDVINLIKSMEKNRIGLSANLIVFLLNCEKSLFNEISASFENNFGEIEGYLFRDSFATKNNLKKEQLLESEIILQLTEYMITYGLEETDKVFFQAKMFDQNIKFKKSKKNNNDIIRLSVIIDVVSFNEFKETIYSILNANIVYNEEMINLLKEAHEYNLLIPLLKMDFNKKIKENIFNLFSIIGMEEFIKLDALSTATDLLRFALFVSDIDNNYLPKHNRQFLSRKKVLVEDFVNNSLFEGFGALTLTVNMDKYVSKLKEKNKGLNYKNTYGEMERYTTFNLKTSHKKYIMKQLNKINLDNALNDIKPNIHLWKALGKNLFPGSAKFSRYSNAQDIFEVLRNSKFETFNGKLDQLLKNKEYDKYISLIKMKPGMLLRSLDYMIRTFSVDNLICLNSVLDTIDLNKKLAIELYKYLEYRTTTNLKTRYFNVKGKIQKIEDKPLLRLNENKAYLIINKLKEIVFKSLIGKSLFVDNVKSVFISPELKTYMLPKELRKASIGNVYTTGSRIKIPDEVKFLRLFTAWGNKEAEYSNFDIDLSSIFINEKIDKNGNVEMSVTPIAYYNQTEDMAVQSGDWTECFKCSEDGNKEMVAEVIDIDLDAAKDAGYSYAITLANIFSSGNLEDSFDKDVNAFSGACFLQDNRKRKTEDRRIKINIGDSFIKYQLQGEDASNVMLAVDLQSREIVIIDKYFKSERCSNVNSLEDDLYNLRAAYLRADLFQENMYNFMKLYCSVNDINVIEQKEDADLIIDIEGSSNNSFAISKNIEKIFNII